MTARIRQAHYWSLLSYSCSCSFHHSKSHPRGCFARDASQLHFEFFC